MSEKEERRPDEPSGLDLRILRLAASGLEARDDGFRILLEADSGLEGREGGFRILLLTASGLEGREGGFRIPRLQLSGLEEREHGLRMLLVVSGLLGLDIGFRMLRGLSKSAITTLSDIVILCLVLSSEPV